MTTPTPMSQSAVAVELALFNNKPGVTGAEIVEASQAMEATLATWPGFIRRELVELGEGRWVDIVHWQSMALANAAVETAMTCPVCLAFFALLDEHKGEMLHGHRRLVQGQGLAPAA